MTANKRLDTLEAEVVSIKKLLEERKLNIQADIMASIQQQLTIVAEQQRKETTALMRKELATFMEEMKVMPKLTVNSMEVEVKEEEIDDAVSSNEEIKYVLPESIPNKAVPNQPNNNNNDWSQQGGNKYNMCELFVDGHKEERNLRPYPHSSINDYHGFDPNTGFMKHNTGHLDGPTLVSGTVNSEGVNSDLKNILQVLNYGAKSDLLYGHIVGPNFVKLEGDVMHISCRQLRHVLGPVFEPHYDASDTKVWDPGIKIILRNTLRTRCFWGREY